uniref:ATP synthase complex subunit 8 n=1 Tax=Trimma caesiura TaxID=512329 RepID=A0A5K7TNU4_9GOBI|nr:ATPase subunit 8 [Trimma caesiura]
MPQLNPTPWFKIATLSWLVLLTIVLPLILARTTPNNPSPQGGRLLSKTDTWAWPWP